MCREEKGIEVNRAVHEAVTPSSTLWLLRQEGANAFNSSKLPRIKKCNYQRWPFFGEIYEEKAAIPDNLPEVNEARIQIIFFGQRMVYVHLPSHLIDSGLILCDLATAMRDYSDIFFRYYRSILDKAEEDKVLNYQKAAVTGGLFLYVPENVSIVEPIEIEVIQNARDNSAHNPHHLFVLGENSQCQIVERTRTEGVSGNSIQAVTELILLSGAKLSHATLDTYGPGQTAYLKRKALIKSHARLDLASGMLNSCDIINDYDIQAAGEGAQAHVKVIAVSDKRQKQIANTKVVNTGRHSVGHILQKGVILEQSRLTFNGIGHILRDAVGADSKQEERILMFSDNARGDANPILLIDENDVTAGHAASVGRVDIEEMYYLMSRGVSANEARKLVIRGFLGSVITAIPVAELRNELIHLIDIKLRGLDD